MKSDLKIDGNKMEALKKKQNDIEAEIKVMATKKVAQEKLQ